MRAGTSREDLHHQQGAIAHRGQFHVGDQTWGDRIGDQIADPLFLVQGIRYTHYPAIIIHANDQLPPSRIGERHQCSQHVAGRRQVTLELERLAFGRLQKMINGGRHA